MDERVQAGVRTMLRACAVGGVLLSTLGPAQAQDASRDLTGIWTIRSMTPMERRAEDTELVISEDEALRREGLAGERADAANARSDLDDDLLTSGSTGGRNSFWSEPGERLARIDGEARSSAIVEPADGRIPFIDREESTAAAIYMREVYSVGKGDIAGIENIPQRARCLVGFGNTGGPAMAPVPYNSTYQFVLTEDHLMILVEMIHDVRIAPIFESREAAQAGHRPDAIKPWLGDSVAWWEDDTLVVETINVYPLQAVESTMPLSPEGVVTERLRRVADEGIYYAFEVDDPAHYSSVWKAEQMFRPVEGNVFEYACHEGSYARDDLLEAARREDRAGK